MASKKKGSLLIKGYLPVRLKFPKAFSPLPQNLLNNGDATDEKNNDENNGTDGSNECNSSFLYIKEHQADNNSNRKTTTKGGNGGNGDDAYHKKSARTTIFVANAPILAGISTSLLLQSIFGRYGNVVRVTVVSNPRKQQQQRRRETTGLVPTRQPLSWTTRFGPPSFLPLQQQQQQHNSRERGQGKFAHVVMQSSKDLKRTLQQMTKLMNNDDDDFPPGVVLDPIELQALADESQRQERQKHDQQYSDDDEGGDEVDDERVHRVGLQRVVHRYRASKRPLNDREALLEECNIVMQQWEEAEAKRRHAMEQAANQPDEDGFVTVSYGSSAGLSMHNEDDGGNDHDDVDDDANGNRTASNAMKRRARQRSRKNKQSNNNNKNSNNNKLSGANPLPDFYRFQTKDNRKRTLHDLRQRFEEDLAKVKKLKEEKQYRPF
ncbi:hypothetical protein ACA910_001677 [Epithemia clementina (nom. ined.)]